MKFNKIKCLQLTNIHLRGKQLRPDYQHLVCPAIPLVYRLWSNFPTCQQPQYQASRMEFEYHESIPFDTCSIYIHGFTIGIVYRHDPPFANVHLPVICRKDVQRLNSRGPPTRLRDLSRFAASWTRGVRDGKGVHDKLPKHHNNSFAFLLRT